MKLWSPTIEPNSITLNNRNALWVKSDLGIMCTFDIEIASIVEGNGYSPISIGGLPIISSNSFGYVGSLYVAYFSNMNTKVNYFAGTISANSTTSELWFNSSASSSLKRLTKSD